MRIHRLFYTAAFGLLVLATACRETPRGAELLAEGVTGGIYDFQVETIDGRRVPMADLRGQVLLIVNVASRCGLTSQYEGLVALYDKYRDQGFEILAFPCNQFGGQEPGTNEEIEAFCRQTYSVRFPVFAKVEVNGEDAHPLFEYLKQQAPGTGDSPDIRWNFTKFLVGRDGTVDSRFDPRTSPQDMTEDIERLLR